MSFRLAVPLTGSDKAALVLLTFKAGLNTSAEISKLPKSGMTSSKILVLR
jgi:hypothetical protein